MRYLLVKKAHECSLELKTLLQPLKIHLLLGALRTWLLLLESAMCGDEFYSEIVSVAIILHFM